MAPRPVPHPRPRVVGGPGRRRITAVVAALVAAAALSACGGGTVHRRGVLDVVAGEDTWGSIAAQLGGVHASVTSLVTNPNADPHEYTASASDAAAVAAAAVVIANGAEYDPFVGQLLAASGTSPTVLTVASLVGATGADPNPHFWYDLGDAALVARAITAAYARHDPADAAYFDARLGTFLASLRPLRAVVATIRRRDAGTPVAYTERVPGYLCAAGGLVVRTPAGFARAVEAGEEPSLADTLAMQHLIASGGIKVLLYNTQTVTPVTTAVRAQARADRVAVVAVTETLASGSRTYQAWQLAQDRALLAALSR